MKKLILVIVVLIICSFAVFYFGLTHSSRFNNFVFSKIINPYDPLYTQTSVLVKKELFKDDAWEDTRGLFPIFAYNLPEKSKDLTASLKIIEKGGINIIINGNWGLMPEPYKIRSAFEQLGSSNLMWLPILATDCRDDFIYGNENDETNSNIRKYLNDFNGNYIYGWYIWDEPGDNRKSCTPLNLVPNDDNADINTMIKQIRSDTTYNKKLDFVNLFPSYWYGTKTAEDYEKYIDAFFSSQEYKPRVLCFDHYPILKDDEGGFRRDFFSDLSIIRKKALEYDVPFWMFVLSSEHISYRKPTFEDISLQVYSALAYGAKGIGYYLYSKSWEHVSYKSWILEDYVDNPSVPDSLHGPLYVPVQTLNKNIQTLGKILTNLKSIEITHTSDYPNKQKGIAQSLFKSNQSNNLIKEILNNGGANTDPKLLIGVFEDKYNHNTNGKYLFVVNKDVTANSNFTIRLNKIYNLSKFDKENGKKVFINQSDIINTNVLPGSGELFYIE